MGAAADAENLDGVLRRCRDGDPGGFAEVYRRLERPLYGTALRMLGRSEEAEDAMQETFVKFCRKVPDVPASGIEPWLRRVLINDCLDRLRRHKRRPEDELDEMRMPGAPVTGGIGLDIERAVAGLPRRARQVFVLHDVEGYRHEDVAAMLGGTVGTSKSQLHRARQLLRARLNRGPRRERP